MRGAPARTERRKQAPLDADEGWRSGGWRREFAARGVTLCRDVVSASGAHLAQISVNIPDFLPDWSQLAPVQEGFVRKLRLKATRSIVARAA